MQNFSGLYPLTAAIAKIFFLHLALFFMPVIIHPLSKLCCGKPDSFLEKVLMSSGCYRLLLVFFLQAEWTQTHCWQSKCSSSGHLGGFCWTHSSLYMSTSYWAAQNKAQHLKWIWQVLSRKLDGYVPRSAGCVSAHTGRLLTLAAARVNCRLTFSHCLTRLFFRPAL